MRIPRLHTLDHTTKTVAIIMLTLAADYPISTNIHLVGEIVGNTSPDSDSGTSTCRGDGGDDVGHL